MIKRLLFFASFIFASVLGAMGQQTEITLSNFHSIKAKGNIELMLVESQSESSITIELHGVKSSQFKYMVKNGVLEMSVPVGLFAPKGYVTVVASTPDLRGVDIDGVSVECISMFASDTFNLKARGGTNRVILQVDSESVVLDVKGKSDVAISGFAGSANFWAGASCRIDAIEFGVDDIVAKACGAAEIYVAGFENLSAKATSTATIYAAGDGKISGSEISGGRVMKIARGESFPMFSDYSDIDGVAPFMGDGTKPAKDNSMVIKNNKDEEDFF